MLAYLAIPVILIPYVVHMVMTRLDTRKIKREETVTKQVTVSFWVDRWGNSIIIDFIEQQSGGIAWRD